jgi:hypothetical protein
LSPIRARNKQEGVSDYSDMLIHFTLLGLKKTSFLNPNLSDAQRIDKISNYWKFTIMRNPLERLLSGFRDKLESPLNYSKVHSCTFHMMRYSIMQTYHPQKLRNWEASKGSSELRVDFQTYIRWIVDTPNKKLNEHFCPMVHLSQPCRVRYDFYGNFKDISTDVRMVLDKHHIPAKYYHDVSIYKNANETATLLDKYYSTISKELKEALFKDFYIDLDYYYHLFPADRRSHMELLGVNELIY